MLARGFSARLSAWSLIACFLLALPAFVPLSAAAQGFPSSILIEKNSASTPKAISVGAGRSVVIESQSALRDVLVSEPTILDAVVTSKNRLYVVGKKVGQASVVLFGDGGQQIASLRVTVQSDPTDLSQLLDRLLPNSAITTEMINDNVILSGTAVSAHDAQLALDIARKFTGDENKVYSAVAVAEKDQVQLRVQVAEVSRTIVKQLGVDLSGSIGFGNFGVGFINENSFKVNPAVTNQAVLGGGFSAGATQIQARVKALQQDGVMRTLAEPTLVAVSGENASFLAGGEFPIPTGYEDGKISLEFKPYGVGLDFTPMVLSSGRIKLRVKTEVSELSSDGAINIANGIAVSALSVRRAESTVEVPSGGTIVMAGLLRDNYQQQISGVPGLRDLPVLGPLFKSRDFINDQTELVVFVTPYVVRAVSQTQMARPTDNLAPPSDVGTVFFNQLNRIYSNSDAPVKGEYRGEIGYIYE
ncbi:type II and III secretion system protein family protein [Rhodobacteraceae bacterium RKSG542]|nr:type II and III secretion system protein family protein [Pseudovibrio flavus]